MNLRRVAAGLVCTILILAACGDDDEDRRKAEGDGKRSLCTVTAVPRGDMGKRGLTFADLADGEPDEKYVVGMGASLFLMLPKAEEEPGKAYQPILDYL